MSFLEDPEQMTPEARMAELAATLAAGCLRLLTSSPQHVDFQDVACSSNDKGLDSCPATSSSLDRESTETAGEDRS